MTTFADNSEVRRELSRWNWLGVGCSLCFFLSAEAGAWRLLLFVVPANGDLRSFVIPAKAGIHFDLLFLLVFGAVAKTDSRPCAFRPPSMAAGHFLFACPKRSNQEKGTLGSAPLATRAVRCGRTGFAHRPSMACCRNRRDPSRRPRFARLFRPPFAASQRDPGAALTLALSRKRETGMVVRVVSSAASAAGTAALSLFPGPSRPRRAGGG